MKKGETYKQKYTQDKSEAEINKNLSPDTIYFKHLPKQEQEHIFKNIDLYKRLAEVYAGAYNRCKDNQFLHAVVTAYIAAVVTYNLASKV